ncbi:FAD binding domain-containing protein [Candidatus Clostridium radicumherbarum]|uniref:FAD binding domain-containing protein n=1 Tax=Candidatus Clostridium radicumherbarum TaxID=3381662 RepID=A0ABW8TNU9_9CLOT
MLNFLKPNSIEDAKTMLNEYTNSKLLAGGTDLTLDLKREKLTIENIIDLGRISELKTITEDAASITLGSMVTFTEVLESSIIKNNYNSLIECAKNMGSPQIRNMATIGGNISNAGSAADVVPCVISLNGILEIESINGTRHISCEDYFKNYKTEKLKENEILIAIKIPKTKELSGFYKLGKRNSLAIARVSAALSLKIEEDTIKNISICLGAVGRYPFRAVEFERQALGKDKEWLNTEEPLILLENDVFESIKGRATMPFKREAIKGVYKEALRTALESK